MELSSVTTITAVPVPFWSRPGPDVLIKRFVRNRRKSYRRETEVLTTSNVLGAGSRNK